MADLLAGLLVGDLKRPPETSATLSDLGISKNQSSRWQALASVPEEDFEAALADSGQRFAAIYADPPWRYEKPPTGKRGRREDQPTGNRNSVTPIPWR